MEHKPVDDMVRLHEQKMRDLGDEMCRRCDMLKKIDDDQWDVINTKASTSSLKWGVGIMIVILISILGSMWKNTTDLSDKMDALRINVIEMNSKISQWEWQYQKSVRDWEKQLKEGHK